MGFDYDVIIIGGGPAGLSAAMSLGRMRRRVLVCDDNRPRNAPADHMNNFASQDGMNPRVWQNNARRDLEKYKTVEQQAVTVLSAVKSAGGFTCTLSNGHRVSSKKLILAYGVQDQLPSIPGFKELWGKSIFHCPYCHGYEARDTKLALIGNGMMLGHLYPMISSLSRDLMLFTNGKADLPEELYPVLKKRGTVLVEAGLKELKKDGEHLVGIVTQDNISHDRTHAFLALTLPFKLKSNIGESLGCEKTEMGFYKLKEMNKTTVEGVFAAGDIIFPQHSVLNAAAAGQMAGAAAVFELVHEELHT